MTDIEVVPAGTMSRIAEAVERMHATNRIDFAGKQALLSLIPVPSRQGRELGYRTCGRCDGRGAIGIREICPRCHGVGRVPSA